MTKALHQHSDPCSGTQCNDLCMDTTALEVKRADTILSGDIERSETSGPMSLGDILKIAELSRKYGPLFYKDPFVMEALDIPMNNLMVSARNGHKDNITLISGVTEDMERKINQLGIWHYDQIISMTDDDILWFEKKMNLEKGYVRINEWQRQCQNFQLEKNRLCSSNDEAKR